MKLNGPCGCCACVIPESAIFSEDWSTAPCGLNAPLPPTWELLRGKTDGVGEGCQFVIIPGQGRFIDLAGTPGNSTIRTTDQWATGEGDHYFVVYLAGENRRGDQTSVRVQFGPVNETIILPWNKGFTRYRWTVPGNTTDKVTFTQVSTVDPAYGSLLNCVWLEPVPAP